MEQKSAPNKKDGLNRRNFIGTTGAAVAGASVLSQLAAPAVHAASSDVLRIALIGCGGRGTGAAAQAMTVKKSVKIVAVADAFRDRLDKACATLTKKFPDQFKVDEDHKFTGFDAYKNAIDSGVDLVILTTPPGFRPIHLDYAVKAKKDVFMEKPVAVDAPGVRSVLASAEIAKKNGTAIAVGLQRHHENQYKETISRLRDGAIGDMLYFRAYWNSGGVWTRTREEYQPKTEMEYQMRNWYYFNWLCGDHILEQHIHNLDVINWLKDDFPVRAEGMGGRQVRDGIDNGEIFDHFAVQYEYKDGTRMYSQCRHIRNCTNNVSEHAHGSKGDCNISRSQITGDTNWMAPRSMRQGGHQQEWYDLIAELDKGNKPMEAEYGAKSTMTAILGRMVCYSGQAIEWKDAIGSNISLAPKAYTWDAETPTNPDENGRYPIPTPGVTKVV